MFKADLSTDELVRGILVTYETVKDDLRYAPMFEGAADPKRRWFDLKAASINAGVLVCGAMAGLATFMVRPGVAEFHLITHPAMHGRWSTRGFWRDCTAFGLRLADRLESAVLADHDIARRLLEFGGFTFDHNERRALGSDWIDVAVYALREAKWK